MYNFSDLVSSENPLDKLYGLPFHKSFFYLSLQFEIGFDSNDIKVTLGYRIIENSIVLIWLKFEV